MKALKKLFPTGLLVLLPGALLAQKNDEAGARRAVQAYLDGMTHGDTTALLRAFDRAGFLDFVKADGTLGRLPVPGWAASWNGRPLDPARFPGRIVKVDLSDNAGYAKVELNWPEVRYVDYLALLRVGNEWKIVSKIWHEERGGSGAIPADEAGIKQAVQAYFDAVTDNRKNAVMRAFHQDAFIMTSRGDRLNRSPFQQWGTFADDKPSPEARERHSKIVSIDQTGARAVAKVDLDWPDVHYIDYLSLMKFGDEWRIINKVWFSEASARSLVGVKDLLLRDAEMAPYLGKYAVDGRAFEVLIDQKRLAVQLQDGPRFELMAQGNHEFALAMSPRDRIVFTVVNGRATQMEMKQFGRSPMVIKRAE
jgi:Putative lumazine-binding